MRGRTTCLSTRSSAGVGSESSHHQLMDPAVACRDDALEEDRDVLGEPLVGRVGCPGLVHRRCRSLHGVDGRAHHLVVETLLAAEVIVDGGDVGARAPADQGSGIREQGIRWTAMRHFTSTAALIVAAFSALAAGQAPPSAGRAQGSGPALLDAAIQTFWNAEDGRSRDGQGRRIVAAGVAFDEVLRRLEAGPAYRPQKTGRVEFRAVDRGVTLDNLVEIPTDYDPARAWPLRVSLHGGVGRQAPGSGDSPARPLANRIPGAGEIVLHPRAWSESAWWTPNQIDNLAHLLDRVKRDYHVDDSRVYVTGISDGGTGVYFLAMRWATPWAACVPLNGHPSVIANPATGADGQLYADDLLQQDLSYELVTLSACETGRANVAADEELIGIGRGFLYAGAGTLILSLWRVADFSTAGLMQHMYQALRAGASKAAALRAAQQAMLVQNRQLHPAFWGAFQLIGDARPLSSLVA